MVAIMTKDAKKSLAKIYKTYQERRSHGMDKLNSKYFDPSDDQETLELAESVREDIPELKKIGFVKAYITGPVSYTHLDVYKRQAKSVRPAFILDSVTPFRLGNTNPFSSSGSALPRP